MLRIRHAVVSDADAPARVMIEANQHAFRGLVPDKCLAWITHQESANNWSKTIAPGGMRDADCLLVAETVPEATVVGFAMGRTSAGSSETRDQECAELTIMSVSTPFQRQGIGRQLVRGVAEHLTTFGTHSMIVRVLAVNPNRAFYERLGAHYVRREPHDWEGVPLSMCVYEWADLSLLLEPRR